MTGNDLKLLFNDKIDSSYSDNLSPARLQRLFDNAFINVIETKYRDLSTEKQHSEISHLIVTDEERNVTNNRIRVRPLNVTTLTFTGLIVTFTSLSEHNLEIGDTFTVSGATGVVGANVTYTVTSVPSVNSIVAADPGLSGTYDSGSASITYLNMYANFLHMFSIKCRMYKRSAGHAVYSVNTTLGRVSFYRPNDVRSNDLLLLENINGITGLPASGEVYANVRVRGTFGLYSDPYLLNPITVTGNYTGGGTVKRISYRNATYFAPDRDIAQLSYPTANTPGVRTADSFLYILPGDHLCNRVKMDYLKKPDVVITISDDSIELLDYYTEKLLNRIVDDAISLYYQTVRAPGQVQMTDTEILQNP